MQTLKPAMRPFANGYQSTDAYIAAKGIDAPPAGEFDDVLRRKPAHLPESEVLDLREAGIGTVIWALGYGYDFSWIGCDVLDARGAPVQQRGVTSVPGLYFLGLPRMHKIKSAIPLGRRRRCRVSRKAYRGAFLIQLTPSRATAAAPRSAPRSAPRPSAAGRRRRTARSSGRRDR